MERSIKGQTVVGLEDVLKSLLSKCKKTVVFDLSYQTTKPMMYNVWIISNKKILLTESDQIVMKLYEKNFIRESEIESVTQELFNNHKLRIAILPKSVMVNFIDDVKNLLKSFDIDFVMNEFLE